jgi:hypothetical protein
MYDDDGAPLISPTGLDDDDDDLDLELFANEQAQRGAWPRFYGACVHPMGVG